MIYIVNGLSGVGKTTFAQEASKVLKERGYEVFIMSTIDPIKAIATSCGWDGIKDNAGRKLLYELKQALEGYNNYATIKTLGQIIRIQAIGGKNQVFFVDIREPAGIEKFKQIAQQDVKTVLLHRSNHVSNEVPELKKMIEDYDYDYIIENDGTLEDLQKKIQDFLKKDLIL